MDIERPFVKEPFVPEQRNYPPEIPDERLARDISFGKISSHVMNSESPVPKVYHIIENVRDDHQYKYACRPEPERPPGILVRHWRHVVEIVMPGKEWDQRKSGDFRRMIP